MPRKVFKDSDEEETTGLFDFEDDDEKKEIPKGDSPSDNEEKLEEDEDEDEDAASDSDDAPEAVSFHSGKETMLAEMREMLQTIKEEKQKKKNKRKKVEELYTAQKKQRLAYLAKRRLPDDVVAALKTPKRETKTHESESETESEVPIPANEEDEVVINPRLLEGGADFLPLDTSVPHARTLKDVKKVERSSKTSLLEFKHKALYGGRIPRQSTKMSIAQQKKRQVAKLPMVPTR